VTRRTFLSKALVEIKIMHVVSEPRERQESTMGRRLYVGNLPYDLSEAELRELFSEAGSCESVTVITDRATGRSRGFAFVEMASAAEASRAIEMLGGRNVRGRALTVSEARESSGGGGGRRRPPGGRR